MKKIVLGTLLVSTTMYANAQNWQFDNTYGTNGYTTNAISGNHNEFRAVKITSNEATIVLGRDFTTDTAKAFIAKFNTNGTLDNTFGNSGITYLNDESHINNDFFSLDIQNDGKIVIAGHNQDKSTLNYTAHVRRFLTNGVVDSAFGTFGVAQIFHDQVTAIQPGTLHNLSIQNDGKILASLSNFSESAITRIKTDGTIDSSFGTNGIVNIDVPTVNGLSYRLVQSLPDGKIIVIANVNYSTPSNVTNEIRAYRLNNDGTLDNTYGTAGKHIFSLNNQDKTIGAYSVQLQNDNKIVVGGLYYEDNNDTTSIFVLRINANGSLDNTFNTQGYLTYPIPSLDAEPVSIYLLGNGKIAATYFDYDNSTTGIVMFNVDGSTDNTFNNQSALKTINNIEQGVTTPHLAFQNDGKIIIAGAALLDNQGETSKGIIGRLEASTTSITSLSENVARIFPNPAKDYVTITLNNASSASVQILDVTGRTMQTNTIEGHQRIDISNIPSGSYILLLQTAHGIAQQKLQIVQ
jgi:uncharacterized delta-60 repeat protein